MKDVHRHFQNAASVPDGPAPPVVFRKALRIELTSMDSNTTGWNSCSSSEMTVLGSTSHFGGYLALSSSSTVLVSPLDDSTISPIERTDASLQPSPSLAS